MKHEVQKIFRGCPFEHKNYESCSECPNYDFCIAKKRARLRAKRVTRLKTILFITVSLLIISILVLGISAIFISNNNESDWKEETDVNQGIGKETPKVPAKPKAELSAEGPSKVYYYDISEEEKIMIAKLVYQEARGESYEGKVAVAAVVLNRYRFDENPYDFKNDSISSVILQKNQFASIETVTMEKLENYPDCMKAVEDACKGWDPTRETFKDGALYFYNPKHVTGKQKEIREGIKFMAIGNHNFHYDFEKVG